MAIEETVERGDGFAFTMKHQASLQDVDTPEQFASPCFQEGALLFLKLDRNGKYTKQLENLNLESVRFDQFGIVSVGQETVP